jgi:hypothetical protein
MNIEISDLRSREIIKILELYPQGHLEIKYESVFWCSDYSEPEPNMRNNPGTPPGVPPNQQRNRSAAEMTRRAADSLGSMMSPQPIRRRE